jgi:hypothetical protein
MHFAEGGYAGGLTGLGDWMNSQYNANVTGMEQALIAAAGGGAQAARTAAGSNITIIFNGAKPTSEEMQAISRSLSAAVGMSL